ncbi:MAG: hypothetical protein M3N47_11300, partial [Chloroflexota bacterium]|nr:hypothetical protein [Chloroflexota bacterium]
VTVIVLVLALTGVAGAAPAAAGTFEVSACDAAPGFVNNSWRLPACRPGAIIARAESKNRSVGIAGRRLDGLSAGAS